MSLPPFVLKSKQKFQCVPDGRYRRGGGGGRVEKLRASNGQDFALKTMESKSHEGTAFQERCRWEVELPGRVRRAQSEQSAKETAQRHVIQILGHEGYTTDEGAPAYAILMEWIEDDLDKVLREAKGKLPPEQATALVATLARAVHVCHTCATPVIHRDLKPANVLLRKSSEGGPGACQIGAEFYVPVLSDFGLAKHAADQGGPANQSKSGDGTPAYMAPEQCDAGLDLTWAVDVYALGVILHQTLTGRLLFDPPSQRSTRETSALPTLRSHLADLAIPPTHRDWLIRICYCCLRKSPNKRYGERKSPNKRYGEWGAAQLAEDLKAFRENRPPLYAPPVTRKAQREDEEEFNDKVRATRQWFSRVLIGAAVVMAFFAVGAAVYFFYLSTVLTKTTADLERETGEKEKTIGLLKVSEEAKGKALDERTKALQLRTRQYEAARYALDLRQAQALLAQSNRDGAQPLLAEVKAEWRGWEWRYLQQQLAKPIGPIDVRAPSPNLSQFFFGPDGTYVAGVFSGDFESHGEGIHFWDPGTGSLRHHFPLAQHSSSYVAISEDKRLLAVAVGSVQAPRENVRVYVYDVQTGKQVHELKVFKKPISCLAFSADGKFLATGSSPDRYRSNDTTGRPELKVFDVGKGTVLLSRTEHRGTLQTVRFSRDGKLILGISRVPFAGGHSNESGAWEIATSKPITDPDILQLFPPDPFTEATALLLHRVESGHITCAAVLPDGSRIITGDNKGNVRVWDKETGQELLLLQGPGGSIRGLAVCPTGKRFAAFAPPTFRIWEVQPGRLLHDIAGHKEPARAVAFHDGGKQFLSMSEKEFKAWDTATGALLRSVPLPADRDPRFAPMHFGSPWKLGVEKVSPDLTCMLRLNGGESSSVGVVVRDLANSQELLRLPATFEPFGPGKCLAVSPNGRRVASCGVNSAGDGQLRIWELPSGQLAHARNISDRVINSAAFSPDGKRLALACGKVNGFLEVRDVETGEILVQATKPLDHLLDVAFSPDGKQLFTAGGLWYGEIRRGEVGIWDAVTGEGMAHAIPNFRAVCLAISPDGQRLAIGTEDGLVMVWEARTGKQLKQMPREKQPILCLAWTPDGKTIIAGSGLAWWRFDDKNTAPASTGVRTLVSWDADTGKERWAVSDSRDTVQGVAVLVDRKEILTFSPGSVITRRNLATGKQLVRVNAPDGDTIASAPHHGGVVGLHTKAAFSKSGDRVVFYGSPLSSDERSQVVELLSGKVVAEDKNPWHTLTVAHFSRRSRHLFVAGSRPNLQMESQLYDLTGKEAPRTLSLPANTIHYALTPDATRMVIGRANVITLEEARKALREAVERQGKRGTDLELWDLLAGKRLFTLGSVMNRGEPVHAYCTPDGTRIVATHTPGPGRSGELWVWDVSSGKRLAALPATDAPPVVEKGTDHFGHPQLIDERTGRRLISEMPYGEVKLAAFSRDGRRMAALARPAPTDLRPYYFPGRGNRPQTDHFELRVWDLNSGKVFCTRHCPDNARSLTFSPDATRLAYVTHDKPLMENYKGASTLTVLDAATGSALLTFREDSAQISSFAFNPDATRIVAAGLDGTVKLYDVTVK